MSKIIITVVTAGVFATSLAASYGADDGSPSSDYFHGHGNGNNKQQQLPVILMHKQALQQDGGFQYAFAADNGLRQGETIRPDGSRTGAYSYTDPEGKEITVKYTAGKDGFRIVQGDHVPKAPLTVVQQQSSAADGGGGAYAALPSPPGRAGKNRLFGAPGGPGSQFNRGSRLSTAAGRFDYNSGEAFSPPSSSFKSSKYAKPAPPVHYRVREDNSAEYPSARYEDDDGSSAAAAAYDGAGDFSSHRPFRAPSFATPTPADDADGPGSDERRPHNFGSGYAFEFAGNDHHVGGAGVVGVSAEF